MEQWAEGWVGYWVRHWVGDTGWEAGREARSDSPPHAPPPAVNCSAPHHLRCILQYSCHAPLPPPHLHVLQRWPAPPPHHTPHLHVLRLCHAPPPHTPLPPHLHVLQRWQLRNHAPYVLLQLVRGEQPRVLLVKIAEVHTLWGGGGGPGQVRAAGWPAHRRSRRPEVHAACLHRGPLEAPLCTGL